jgi:hypothetical protein
MGLPWLEQSSLMLASVSAAWAAVDPLLILPEALNCSRQTLRAAELSRHALRRSSSFMVAGLTKRGDLVDLKTYSELV